MTQKEFIEKAWEGGYEPEKLNHEFEWDENSVTDNFQIDIRHVVLDPLAWQAVGTTQGWSIKRISRYLPEEFDTSDGYDRAIFYGAEWKYKMLMMTYALIEGKSLEEYIATL